MEGHLKGNYLRLIPGLCLEIHLREHNATFLPSADQFGQCGSLVMCKPQFFLFAKYVVNASKKLSMTAWKLCANLGNGMKGFSFIVLY